MIISFSNLGGVIHLRGRNFCFRKLLASKRIICHHQKGGECYVKPLYDECFDEDKTPSKKEAKILFNDKAS